MRPACSSEVRHPHAACTVLFYYLLPHRTAALPIGPRFSCQRDHAKSKRLPPSVKVTSSRNASSDDLTVAWLMLCAFLPLADMDRSLTGCAVCSVLCAPQLSPRTRSHRASVPSSSGIGVALSRTESLISVGSEYSSAGLAGRSVAANPRSSVPCQGACTVPVPQYWNRPMVPSRPCGDPRILTRLFRIPDRPAGFCHRIRGNDNRTVHSTLRNRR